MLQNVISSSFEGLSSVTNAVELQEAFHHLSNRDVLNPANHARAHTRARAHARTPRR
jgi:hypothetical protein